LWILIVLVCLAVLLLFLLCLPIELSVRAELRERRRLQLKFTWLFGLVNREITGKKEKRGEKKETGKSTKKRRRLDPRIIFSIIQNKGLLPRLKTLVKDLFSRLKFRDLAADLTIGLGDPGDTGMLFAFIGPVTAFFGSSHRHRIAIKPSFDSEAVLHGDTKGTIKIYPVQLIPPFFKFVFSVATIRVAGDLIKSKWGRK